MGTNNSDINDKGSGLSSSQQKKEEINYEKHWDDVYINRPEKKLGWYETDVSPTMDLLTKTNINKSSTVLIVGAGSTTLVDELLKVGYSDIIATDLSKIALQNLEERIEERNVEYIIDDLTHPEKLKMISPVDLWIDRAVLHFFTKEEEQNNYFELLKSKVKKHGFVLLAEFNLEGSPVCAGLPVHRYSKKMLEKKLGIDFELIESFNHIYHNPSGGERPYVYTLFRKK
jgi:hypothetical protein